MGRDGPTVTRMGLGLAALGRPAYINLGRRDDLRGSRSVAAFRQRSAQVLDHAYELGLRYFDAARSYGRAEEFLADWLRSREPLPEAVVCGSKWGYTYVGRWRMDVEVHEVKDHSLTQLRRQLEESRSWLGGHLNLYQIHSATLESGVLDDLAVLRELLSLARGGVQIGLTVSGVRQGEVIRKALELAVDGDNPFSCVQATWNPLEPSAGPALNDAHRAGWGVIIKEALANGRLAASPESGGSSAVEALARSLGVGRDAISLAFVLSQEWVDVALSGAVTVEQLDSNVQAFQVASDPSRLEVLEGLAEPPQQYWSKRANLPWS